MINWANVRFSKCRVCQADLGNSLYLRKDHWAHEVKTDLCGRCIERVDRWFVRKCKWEFIRFRRGKGTYTIGQSTYKVHITKEELEHEIRLSTIIIRDCDWPVPDNGIVQICLNPQEYYRKINSLDITEWVNMQLERVARKFKTAAASAQRVV